MRKMKINKICIIILLISEIHLIIFRLGPCPVALLGLISFYHLKNIQFLNTEIVVP